MRLGTTFVLLALFAITAEAQPQVVQSFKINMAPGNLDSFGKGFVAEPFVGGGKDLPSVRVELHLQCAQRSTKREVILMGPKGNVAAGGWMRMTLRDFETGTILSKRRFALSSLGVKNFTEVFVLPSKRTKLYFGFDEAWTDTVNGRKSQQFGSLVDWEGSFATVLADSGSNVQFQSAKPAKPRFKVD